MNNEVKKALNQLELRKKAALTQNSESFPEKFYSVAEFFLTNPIFQPIVNEIDQERNDYHVVYDQMAVGIHRLLDCIYGDIVRYVQGKQIPVKALDDINFLSASKGKSLVEIFKKAWAIKRIFKELPERQHAAFISENQPKVTLLNEKLNLLGVENERLRKLEKEQSYELLRRFRAIVVIYNSEECKELRNELIDSGEVALIQSHDIRYQGLSKCIYPGTETQNYDENFGMQNDKMAIQKICALAKRKLSPKKKTINDEPKDKKMYFKEKDNKVRIFVGNEEKNPIKKNSNRGTLALLFSKKKSWDGENLINKLNLKHENLSGVIGSIKDFNKLFNNYGITAALQIKETPSHLEKKIEISRNPAFW